VEQRVALIDRNRAALKGLKLAARAKAK